MQDFEKTSLVVCLLVDAESVLDRIRNDDTRPLLAHDKENAIVELLESRKELYGAVTHKIDTSGRAFPPVQTAEEIIDLYQSMDS